MRISLCGSLTTRNLTVVGSQMLHASLPSCVQVSVGTGHAEAIVTGVNDSGFSCMQCQLSALTYMGPCQTAVLAKFSR